MPKTFFFVLLFSFSLAACNSEIYVVDGVTDGDTFYLAERALSDDDPVLQSWVTYSLAKSTCQLQIGGANPARASSYECELTARRLLIDSWREKKALHDEVADNYLDQLAEIQKAGYLDEYVVDHFGKKDWQIPGEVNTRAYRRWRRQHLGAHRAETHIIGSWNYARNVHPL
ncbi:MAG: hypothetical protein ACR2Q3_16570 [Woeseiaceae bacterium]